MSLHFRRSRLNSKPLYRITADLKQGIITIRVYDATKKRRWRSEFSQKNFPKQPIFDVASTLMDAINSMKSKNAKKIENFVPISISEYYKWCYVSVNGTDLPVFALRPVITSKSSRIAKSSTTTMKDHKSTNDILNEEDDVDVDVDTPSSFTRIHRQMTF